MIQKQDWSWLQEEFSKRARSGHGKLLASQFQLQKTLAAAENFRAKTLELLQLPSPELNSLHSIVTPAVPIHFLLERTLKQGVLSAEELWQVATLVEALDLLSLALQKNAPLTPILAELFSKAPKQPRLVTNIKNSVDSSGVVLDTASPELRSLRSRLITMRAQFEDKIQKKLQEWKEQKILQDDFYDTVDGRVVVPVKASEKSELPGILVGKSKTEQSVYLEPLEFTALNNEVKTIELQIEAEISRILTALSGEVANCAKEILPWVDSVFEMDLSAAATVLACEWKLSKPARGSDLHLKNAFHPTLLTTLAGVEPQKNTVQMTKGQSLLISGPNTGGKTVLLKTIGMIAAMYNAGFLIPADEGSELPFFETIAALIGDDQNIQKGLSSFSAEIHAIKELLHDLKTPALVLIDEMFSSTNPDDASALSMAVLEHLSAYGAFCVVSTHFTDLILEAQKNPDFRIGAMEFKNGKPTYRLCAGEVGLSHALEIAEGLQLPREILQAAKKRRSPVHEKLLEIEKVFREREKLLQNEHTERLQAVEKERVLVQKENIALKTQLKAQAEEFMKGLKLFFEENLSKVQAKLLTQIRQGAGQKIEETVRSEFRRVEKEAADKTDQLFSEEKTIEKRKLQEGDTVRVRSLRQSGVVLKLDTKGTALLQVGSLKISRPLDDLEYEEKKQPVQRPRSIDFEAPSSMPTRLDLRGLRAEEAVRKAESYLDQALRSGAMQVEIITGHGTGAIKNAVKELLKKLPYVERVEPGREHDDGLVRVYFG